MGLLPWKSLPVYIGIVLWVCLSSIGPVESSAASGLIVKKVTQAPGQIIGAVGVDGRTTPASILYGRSSGAFQWDFETDEVVAGTDANHGGNSGVVLPNGIWIDENGYYDPNNRKAIVCHSGTNSMIWEVDLDTGAAQLVHTITQNTFPLTACVIDFEYNIAWLSYDRRIRRVPMGPPGTTWPQPTGSYQTTTTAGYFRVGALDTVNNYAYFAGDNAVLTRVPRDYQQNLGGIPFKFERFTVGAGALYSLSIDWQNNQMYFGTDIGLAFALSPIGSFGNAPKLFFAAGQKFDAVVVDPRVNVTYWGTSLGNIFRLQLPDFNTQFDSEIVDCSVHGCAPATVPLTTGLFSPDTNAGYFSTGTNPAYIVEVQLFDCSNYSSCSQCSMDPTYCGWCLTTQQCTQAQECPPGGLFLKSEDTCPTIDAVSPPAANSLGNTSITVQGKHFINDPTTKCRFDSNGVVQETPVDVFVDSTSIICRTPPNGVGSALVDVTYLGVAFTSNSFDFSFYDCDGASCDSCYSLEKSDCGWCIAEGFCSNSATCGDSTNFGQAATCPSIAQIDPSSGIDDGNTLVSVSGQFLPDIGYQCLFGTTPVNATKVSDTQIQCISPGTQTPGNVAVSFSVLYRETGIPYANNPFTFNYYNCDLSESCSQCFFVEGLCTWCLETGSCHGSSSPNATACSTPFTSAEICPSLLSLQPASMKVAATSLVTVSGTYFYPVGQFDTRYTCIWSELDNPAVTSSGGNALWVNSTTVQCQSLLRLTSGTSYLSINFNDKQYAPEALPLFYYDCDGLNCGQCATADRPLCEWCIGSGTCIDTSLDSCNGTAPSTAQCPALLEVFPTQSHTDGGVLVTASISLITPPFGIGYECRFGGIIVEAAQANETALTCEAPPSTSGEVPFQILLNGVPYSPDSVVFTYYACSDLDTQCDDCLLFTQCGYCLPFTCYEKASETCATNFQTTECPTIMELSPDHAPAGDAADITVWGNRFIAGEYSCRYGAEIVPAQFINRTNVICNFPPQEYATEDLFILYDGQSYTSNQAALEFYDCNLSASQGNCSICSLNPSSYCGWCLSSFQCGTVDTCSDVDLWTISDCPTIFFVEPSYSSIEGDTEVRILGSGFSSAVSISCRFGSVDSPAQFVSTTELSCVAPPAPARRKRQNAAVNLALYVNNQLFSSNSFSFEYIDCGTNVESQVCGECTLNEDSRCNWCVADNYCAPSQKCDINWPVIPTSLECPRMTRLSPLVGSLQGDTLVSIFGIGFIDHPNIQCVFGDIKSNVTFINGTIAACNAPTVTQESQVDVFLAFGDKQFTSNILSFQYQVPVGSLVESTDNYLALILTASLIGSCLIILLVIAVSLVLLRRRRSIKKVKLLEPDYAALSLQGTLSEYDIDRSTAEKLQSLEQLLLAPNLNMVSAICDITPVSEVDNVTKAILYIFESSDETLRLLKHFITREVDMEASEATLFRASSIICRMASHYAKMIGLPYLWRTLALAIHEVNDLGEESESSASRYETMEGMHSIMSPTSMEVDPHKLHDGEDAVVNQLQLMLISQKLFNSITHSVDSMPLNLRRIYSHIRNEVEKKFEGRVYTAVAGFLFIRFICPSILAPHVYGLLPEPPNQEAQRYLILLSKTLQNLALGTFPGKKEDYMQKMNEFITTNRQSLEEFIDHVTKPSGPNDKPVDLPDSLRLNALAFLHNHIANNASAIFQWCEKNPESQSLHDDLSELMIKLGIPNQPKSQ